MEFFYHRLIFFSPNELPWYLLFTSKQTNSFTNLLSGVSLSKYLINFRVLEIELREVFFLLDQIGEILIYNLGCFFLSSLFPVDGIIQIRASYELDEKMSRCILR